MCVCGGGGGVVEGGNSFGAKFQTTFVFCFSIFNKLSLEKKFIAST